MMGDGELASAEVLAEPSLDVAARATRWSWGIVAVGVALRLIRYFADRSLWLDESFLTESILTYSFGQLATEPLANWQAAPVGFLYLEKIAVLVLGTSEYALRLVPLIAGVASMPLFRAVAWRCLPSAGALVALTLFATIEPLVYYSNEVKQYGVDVAIALAIVLATLRVIESPERTLRIVALGFAGAASLFLSHPAVFVLAGAGVALAGVIFRSDAKTRIRLIAIAAGWLVLFTLDYALLLRQLTKHEGLNAYWSAAYMPYDLSAIPWLGWSMYDVFADYSTMWMPLPAIAVLAAAIGLAWLWQRDRRVLALVATPVMFAVAAAALHRFPFSGRLILFVVPLATLWLGAGVQAVWDTIGGKRWLVGALATLWILSPTVGRALYFAVLPPGREEIKTVLAHMRDHRLHDDRLYVLNLTQTPFKYYRDGFGVGRDRFGISTMQWVAGHAAETTEAAFAEEFESFRGGGRLWILLTHFGGPPVDEGAVIPAVLDRMGRRKLDDFSARGARVMLYDLPATPATLPARSGPTPGGSPPR